MRGALRPAAVSIAQLALGLALAASGSLGACAAFDSDPTSPADAGAPDDDLIREDIATPPVAFDTGVVPNVDPASGCATTVKPPTLAFCSDFDDAADPYAGWSEVDPEGVYTAAPPFVSPPFSARIALLKGGGNSPDARIRRSVGGGAVGTRFTLAGSVRIETPEAGVYRHLVRLDMRNGTGSVWIRPNGALVESRRNPEDATSSTYTSTTGTVPLTDDRWHAFRLFVDLSTNNRIAIAEVDGKSTSLALGQAKVPGAVDAVLGPAEPSVANQPAVVYFDNVTAFREP